MPLNYRLFVLSALGLTAFIGYGTFATARLLQHWRPGRNLLLLPGENLLRLGLIVICLALGRLSGLDAARLGWQVQHPGRQAGWGVAVGLAMGALFYYATRRVMQRAGQRFYSPVVIEQIAPANRREAALVLLAMGPVVLLEELLFRSLLLGGLAPVVPLPALLFGLSVLFGLFHIPQGVWGVTGAGLAGLVLGALFLWQGSLLAPLAAHYVTNVFQVCMVGGESQTRP